MIHPWSKESAYLQRVGLYCIPLNTCLINVQRKFAIGCLENFVFAEYDLSPLRGRPPDDAVGRRQHVAVVDQGSATERQFVEERARGFNQCCLSTPREGHSPVSASHESERFPAGYVACN